MRDPNETDDDSTDDVPLGGVTEFLIQFDVTDEDDPELVDVVQYDR